jgi:malate synthase
MPSPVQLPNGVRVRGAIRPGYEEILTPAALRFLATLTRHHAGKLRTLLTLRQNSQDLYDLGKLPGFLKATADVRAGDWKVAPVPEAIADRRVEITGPVERKMIINALNSGARVFMADFEDSSAPTWDNMVQGQINLRDAVAGTITFEAPGGKTYRLAERTAALFVRPRGLHLPEAHLEIDGQPIPASLFDFGLYFFHNAQAAIAKGAGPWFYLPKMESHLDAGWWNEVFVHAQKLLGVPQGTIKATVLIETLPASFQAEEILWQLRDHSAGLNCGRWDYIFSYIKVTRAHHEFVLPDRGEVTMTQPNMRAYTQRVIQVCHRRGAHAMGGMAAQIPIKGDDAANEAALDKVRADKLREVTDGHDGTWVAHPALVPIAMEIFDAHMPTPNQIARQREDVDVDAADLLTVPKGKRTWDGLCHNLRVGVQYVEAWLSGNGCVPLYNLMEDAATAEISRAQVWQWVKHGAILEDRRKVTVELFREALAGEMASIRAQLGDARFDGGKFARAIELFDAMITADELPPFLTLAAYGDLVQLTD